MDIIKHIFVLVHFLGLAALIGGAFVQWNTATKQASPTMVWGARMQLITGIILLALVETTEQNVQHIKFAVKLIVNVIVVGVLESSRKNLSNTAFQTATGLSILNVAVALFWTTSSEGEVGLR
jgi:hypothetical protein